MASKQLTLKVTMSPASELALTNKVYVNPADYEVLKSGSPGNYMKVANYVFTFADHPGTAQGSIGFNVLHRRFLLFGLNDKVTVTPFNPPAERQHLSTLTLEVDFFKPTKRTDEFKPEAFTNIIKRDFTGQIFSENQPFISDVEGNNIQFKVKKCNVVDHIDKFKPDTEDNTEPEHVADFGMLHKNTTILYEKAPSSTLKIAGDNNKLFKPSWKFDQMGVGGLDGEFSQIFQLAFASRVYPTEVMRKLNQKHVRGLMLYGPPGTGKTLMAKQIATMLNAKCGEVVNGPSILSKYVGQAEENMRNLFKPAIQEWAEKGDQSDLHIIIFDEIDAICKQRGSRNDGTGTGDSIVNQLLSMMDGVDTPDNFLVIGMTNRLDMIDEALLRDGRFEIKIEINLPDEKGRHQILKIHTKSLYETKSIHEDVNLLDIAARTKNYSGSEIAGMVRHVTGYAMSRNIDITNGVKVKDSNIMVTQADFDKEIIVKTPMFGLNEKDFENTLQNGAVLFGKPMEKLFHTGNMFVQQIKNSTKTPLLSILLDGINGSGKSSIAAKLALESKYPYIKLLSAESMVGYSETGKVAKINKVFEDSYRSPLSFIVIDDLERLLDYSRVGPRFSNVVLQTLLILLKKDPPKGKRLLVISTTSNKQILDDLELLGLFHSTLSVPLVSSYEEFKKVVDELKFFENGESIDSNVFQSPIPVKKLITLTEMAKELSSGTLSERMRELLYN